MESLGARLKKLRLEKGLSLEDVHKATKLHLNILNAIEEDRLSGLNPIYVKGFLKIYCKFLGIDPKIAVSDIKEAKPLEEIMLHSYQKAHKVTPLSTAGKKKSNKLIGYAIVVVMALLVVFGLGRLIFGRPRSAQTKAQKKVKAALVKKSEKSKSKPPKAVKVESEVKPVKDFSSGIRLSIRAKENCWVYLRIDGKVVFQRVLEKGRFETWSAKERVDLSLGNAAAVELEVNGQLFSSLGRKGQVRKNIVITKEGLNIS